MSSEAKLPKLIIVMAFDRNQEGELQTVFSPVDQQSGGEGGSHRQGARR